MDPTLFEEFTREFTAEINRQRVAASAAGAALQSRIERIEGQIKRLVDAIIEGADAKPINDRLKELEAERGRLIGERGKVPEGKPLLHPNLAAVYRRHVEELGAALRDPEHGQEAFELIRSLIEEVRLVPRRRRAGHRAEGPARRHSGPCRRRCRSPRLLRG